MLIPRRTAITGYSFLLPLFLLLFLPVGALANNVSVSNVSISGQDGDNYTAQIEFDLSWSNSWRNNTNHDAVWVFAKYSTDSGSTWKHVILKGSGTNPSGYSTGSGTSVEIIVPNDNNSNGYGCIIQRSANGTGAVSVTDIQLVWNWGGTNGNGLSASTSAIVKVYAIEMVYIPQGIFEAGDYLMDQVVTNCFYDGKNETTYSVESEDAITVDNSTGCLWYDQDNTTGGDRGGPIPAAFPKGYNAFYLMKYEISQGQYRNFLNAITRASQAQRVATTGAGYYVLANNSSSPLYRNSIRTTSPLPTGTTPITFGCDFDTDQTFNESNDGEWIACNYLHAKDIFAYADWAALRPMTELEYEKACRGPNPSLASEYAWGSTTIIQTTGLSSTGTSSEVPSNSDANCNYNNPSFGGPIRVGAHTTDSSTRVSAGAGYYGNMELSGNVAETAISVGHQEGRSFVGTHGDGVLFTATNYEGNATNLDWPGWRAGSGVHAYNSGISWRTGSWFQASSYGRVADRNFGAYDPMTRTSISGGRLARSVETGFVSYQTKAAGTYTNDDSYGDTAWTTTGTPNVYLSSNESSYYLKATNFNFSIPTDATILGIMVEYRRYWESATAAVMQDDRVRLISPVDGIKETDRAKTGTEYPDGDYHWWSYGGSSDLWGEGWTPGYCNETDFGVAYSCVIDEHGVGGDGLYVHAVNITVFYQTP